MQEPQLVGYGVDTLLLNVRYTDKNGQPVKQELDEKLASELDDLQHEARKSEMAMISPWSFLGVSLFMEPHGAGRQWRWVLTSRLLNLTVSRGTFNDLIAQVRFSSKFLWSQAWCGDALSKVHAFLMSLFGESIHLQVSEVHLCADVVGFDFSQVNYEEHFVTRVRKNDTIYSAGVDGVSLDVTRFPPCALAVMAARYPARSITRPWRSSRNRARHGSMICGARVSMACMVAPGTVKARCGGGGELC